MQKKVKGAIRIVKLVVEGKGKICILIYGKNPNKNIHELRKIKDSQKEVSN